MSYVVQHNVLNVLIVMCTVYTSIGNVAFFRVIAVEIIFDYRDPSLPPDIVLSDSDFNPDIQKLAVSYQVAAYVMQTDL